MRAAVIVPAFQAERTVGQVVGELARIWPEAGAVLVIDDGSTDRTSERAAAAGAIVLRHARNQGKGAALRTGMRAAQARGFSVVVSVDADGQHPPREALRVRGCSADPAALVVGVRDMAAARAPKANQRSNAFSNFAVSGFAWKRLSDTQCGLRRYPIDATLGLGSWADGYGYEAEVLIRAAAARLPIVEIPIRVIYPPQEDRVSHFDPVWDPTKMVFQVVSLSALTRIQWIRSRLAPSHGRRARAGAGRDQASAKRDL